MRFPQKNVLFDFDGTLFDTSPGILRGIRCALEKSGRAVGEDTELYKFIGPPLLSRAFMEFYGMSEEEAEHTKEVYRAYYREKGVFECAPYPGAEECLRALQCAGRSLAVATSKPIQFARQILERFGFARYFAAVCGAESDAHAGKAEIVAAAIKQLNAEPFDCIMVGDRKYDILGAQENGIPCLALDSGFAEPGEYAEAGAVAVVRDYAELKRLLTE